jgi:hypothetical protein|tara:strand:+ start:8678 stop:8836 length:159 start_codon:yes stop_codon:yes gene_type:complete
MKKVKEIVNSPLFKSMVCGAIGIALIAESHSLYAGLAFGVGLREFLLAFKTL